MLDYLIMYSFQVQSLSIDFIFHISLYKVQLKITISLWILIVTHLIAYHIKGLWVFFSKPQSLNQLEFGVKKLCLIAVNYFSMCWPRGEEADTTFFSSLLHSLVIFAWAHGNLGIIKKPKCVKFVSVRCRLVWSYYG